MKVLYVTSEAAPFCKTGGLGDVAGALPEALNEKRIATRVIMPLYGSISEEWRQQMKFVKYFYVNLSWRNQYCGLFELKYKGTTYYFLDNEYYFKRNDLYGHFDDGERFAFFSKAVAVVIPELDWHPDVVHCNDWQSALVPIYLRTIFSGREEYDDLRTVFTIHNIEYQGRYARNLLEDVFGLPSSLFNSGTIEWKGGLNLMKAAIELSDAVTTVSKTYSEELQYAFYAHGLEGVIACNKHKVTGILNGIDTDVYNPATDKNLVKNYTVSKIADKGENKAEIQKLLGLTIDPSIPVIGMVSRLVSHKGLDLVSYFVDKIMELDVQFVIIGRGDWHFEQQFSMAQNNYAGRFSTSLMYNPSLAMKIYSGADMFLMPSQSEPCGLAQMIAMRYGTIPIVRETGGLKDTVIPYIEGDSRSRGFSFANYNADDMLFVIKEAVDLYNENPKEWLAMQKRDMETDFSWDNSIAEYKNLYRDITSVK